MNTKEVKCLIWDLDDTLWEGVLAENDRVTLKPGIGDILDTLDRRGILLSIASRNNFDDCWKKLEEFGIAHYFLYPEISWNAKSSAVANIVRNLNIGSDTIAFIDDQPFERDEVQSLHPQVECIDARDYLEIPERMRFNPRFISEEAIYRRSRYQENIRRTADESSFAGPKEDFLRQLGMVFRISRAGKDELARAEELTVRTHQLNATGLTFSHSELEALSTSDRHYLLTAELSDRYGSYGKIGLALIEKSPAEWRLRLLLMSCRVMSRGVGTVLLTSIMEEAKKEGVRLLADFRETERNRNMYITYKFANFYELANDKNGNIVFANDLDHVAPTPEYIDLQIKL